VGYLGWNWLFPGDETRIKRVLAGAAEAASIKEDQGLVGHATAVTKLIGYLSPDVEVYLDVPELGTRRIEGRDEVQSLALATRRDGSRGLKVELLDPIVRVDDDGQSAIAEATARVKEAADRDYHVQEVRFHFKKIEDDWLISRAEPVRTFGE
jgi:hypothetical protein